MLPYPDGFLPTDRDLFYLVTLSGAAFEGSLGVGPLGAIRPNDSPCP
jgi:hypothetical protein